MTNSTVQNGGAPDCGPNETSTASTGDGSGYTVAVSGGGSHPTATLYTPTGGVGPLPLNAASPGTTFTEPQRQPNLFRHERQFLRHTEQHSACSYGHHHWLALHPINTNLHYPLRCPRHLPSHP